MGREAGFHYSSVLDTAEGAQKAGQMKMGSGEMWTIAQFSSDYKVTVIKALRLSVLIYWSYGIGALEDYRTKFCSVSWTFFHKAYVLPFCPHG